MIGPGKYDYLADFIRFKAVAEGVVLIVLNGNEGSGASCKLTPELMAVIPDMLRQVADGLEADHKKFKAGLA